MLNNVIIVSAYGRGYDLAHQLNQKNIKVTVCDISSVLPVLSSADREGPFGVFIPHFLSDWQKKYLCGDNFYPIPQGFSILNAEGPLEFQGPLSDFLIETRKDFRLCYNWMTKKKQERSSQAERWLLCLAKALTNSYLGHLYPKAKLVKKNRQNGYLPFFSDYILRESSQRYFSTWQEEGQKKGIRWLSPSSQPLDLEQALLEAHSEGSTTPIIGQQSPLSSIDQKKPSVVIWTLNGVETARHFPKHQSLLFPKWKEPAKIWLRFSLSWKNKEKVIPAILLITPDPKGYGTSSPLSAQFMVLKHHPSARLVDLWLLCPYSDRFNQATLKDILQSALKRLRTLFLRVDLQGFLPEKEGQEYFVLYEKPYQVKKRFLRRKNGPAWPILHLNLESAGRMDPYSLMLESQRIAQLDLFKKVP